MPKALKMTPFDARWDLREALILHWTGHRTQAVALLAHLARNLDVFHEENDHPEGIKYDTKNDKQRYYEQFWQ